MASNNPNTPALVPSRKRRPETWIKAQKKAKRDSGQSYVSCSGAMVEEKTVGPVCMCRNKCYEKVGVDNVNMIFKMYWGLKSHDLQSHYIHSRVHAKNVARCRVKGRASRKNQSKSYSVVVENESIDVCFVAFLNMHAITDKRVRNVLAKASVSPTATPAPDQRGRQEPSNKTPPLVLDIVETFCKKLPTCQSHYSRTKTPDKVYLPPGSTWIGLFASFQDYLEEEGMARNVIKLSRFIKKVHEYKISITAPKSDTCSTCDTFNIQFECLDPVADAEKIAALTVKRNNHQCHAEVGRRFVDVYAKDKTPTVFAITIDLQQTLVTPRLTTSAQYYRCKMWSYNFGIHDLKASHPYFYVWNESEAKRGSCEVASCLQHFINNYVPSNILKLMVFSDNCAGQNKNINLSLFYLRQLHDNKFSSIHHYYLEPGHSYLPCDSDFGVLEKHLRGKEVYTTEHYTTFMQSCRRKDPATVVRMTADDFLDFEVLQGHVTKARQTNVGFKKARRIMVDDDYLQGVKVCGGYGEYFHEIKEWKLQKGRSRDYDPGFNLARVDVPRKYPSGVVMNKKKLQHLKEMLQYIPQAHKAYYTTLFTAQANMDDDNSEDVDDPTDDFLEY